MLLLGSLSSSSVALEKTGLPKPWPNTLLDGLRNLCRPLGPAAIFLFTPC